MLPLLRSVSRQLSVSAPPGGVQAAASAGRPHKQYTAASGGVRCIAACHCGRGVAARPQIDERYRALRDLVGAQVNAPIELVLRELGDAQQQIAKLAATLVSTGPAATAPGGIDPLLALKADAARQPGPLDGWLTQIASSAIALRSGDPRQQLATIFDASGGPGELCPAVTNGRYPFVPNATDDAPLDGFARLFAPGGVLDGFVNTLLLRYIDTSAKPWRLISADAASAPVTPADLAQFQRAAMIRDAFFADSGTRPRVVLNITPVSADAATRRVTLDLDGTAIVYTSGGRQSNFGCLRTSRCSRPCGDIRSARRRAPVNCARPDRGRSSACSDAVGYRRKPGSRSLHAHIPAWRSAGGVRCADDGDSKSADTRIVAGFPLSGREDEVTPVAGTDPVHVLPAYSQVLQERRCWLPWLPARVRSPSPSRAGPSRIKPGSAVEFELAPDGRVVLTKVGGRRRRSRFEALRGRAGKGLSTDEIMALTRGEPPM